MYVYSYIFECIFMICLLWGQAPGCQKSLQGIPKINISTTTYMWWWRECIICCWNPIRSWHHLGLTASWPAGMCRSSICIIQLELSSPAMGGGALHNSSWLSFQHNTQLIHKGVHCTHGSRKGIHSLLALVTLVQWWCGPSARCFLPRQAACGGKGLGEKCF